MADAAVSKTAEDNLVWVRLPPSAHPWQSRHARRRRAERHPRLPAYVCTPAPSVRLGSWPGRARSRVAAIGGWNVLLELVDGNDQRDGERQQDTTQND